MSLVQGADVKLQGGSSYTYSFYTLQLSLFISTQMRDNKTNSIQPFLFGFLTLVPPAPAPGRVARTYISLRKRCLLLDHII